MATDLVSFIPGIGPTKVFSPGASTPPPYNVTYTGVTDGTGPTTASANVSELYNRLLVANNAIIQAAGYTVDHNNWTQITQAINQIAFNNAQGVAGNITTISTTPPQFDNSLKIASTAFVQRAGGNFGGFNLYTNSSTMVPSDAGKLVAFVVNTPGQALTLPLASSVPSGSCIHVSCSAFASGDLGFRYLVSGSDILYNNGGIPAPGNFITSSLFLTATFAQTGNTAWALVGGSLAARPGNFIGDLFYAGSTVLRSADVGKSIGLGISSPGQTVTLPSASTVANGSKITLLAAGSGTEYFYTVAVQNPDTAYYSSFAVAGNAFDKLKNSQTVEFTKFSNAGWSITGGEGVDRYSTNFRFGTGGNVAVYQDLPSGFAIQAGFTVTPVPTGSSGLVIAFAESFPTACVGVVTQYTNSAVPTQQTASNVLAVSQSNFTLAQQTYPAGAAFNWIAIGY